MKHISAFAAPFLLVSSAFAQIPNYDRQRVSDDLNVVGFSCDSKNGILELGYFTGYNLPQREIEMWDTFELKVNKKRINAVKSIRTVRRSCRLGKDKYVVVIRGVPGNWNLNGECGGRTFAGAEIRRNGIVIYDSDFETCGAPEVTASVVLRSTDPTPRTRIVSHRDFYGI